MSGCIRWDWRPSSHNSAPAETQWAHCHAQKGNSKFTHKRNNSRIHLKENCFLWLQGVFNKMQLKKANVWEQEHSYRNWPPGEFPRELISYQTHFSSFSSTKNSNCDMRQKIISQNWYLSLLLRSSKEALTKQQHTGAWSHFVYINWTMVKDAIQKFISFVGFNVIFVLF